MAEGTPCGLNYPRFMPSIWEIVPGGEELGIKNKDDALLASVAA
jgi:hypothetical protein